MFNNQRYSGSMAHGFMHKVYGWMCAGLATTAAVSYYLSPEVNPALLKALTSHFLLVIGLFVAQIGLIFYMMSNFAKLSYTTLGAMFIAFSALEGVTLAPILYMYTAASVFYVFLIAAAMFAAMAVYGWLTDADLSSMGNILLMGMIGLIVANLINAFVQSASFSMVISCFGVGIFAMLTAYDVQNLKKYSQYGISSPEEMGKYALIGAMSLYLNLINIFIYLLQLFGERRQK